MPELPADPNAPYCHHCRYDLSGLTESSKCPECGRPFVEVLMRQSFAPAGAGRRYRSAARVFGLPVIDIAFGPHESETRGRAKGIVALGDIATGVLAVGGMARGGIAIGGFAIGGITVGGSSFGLLSAVGGWAMGGLATGGGAVGGIATGGGAVGGIATGGGAFGYIARGGGVVGTHVIAPGAGVDPIAQAVFTNLSWLLGPPGIGIMNWFQPGGIQLGLTALLAALIAVWAFARDRKTMTPI